ncbi:MAG: sodium:solute symporter [Calditrichia bacterium]
MPAWQIAFSIMATQVSAISLIGAPAFVALKPGGGLFWLQYEFAIPLSMIAIMFFLVPFYRKKNYITIYQFIHDAYGSTMQIVLSIVFLISRGLGSGVALLATSIVTSAILEIPLIETILLIGIVSIIYTTFGGIVADIYSDIIQLAILWIGTFIGIGVLLSKLDPAGSLEILRESHRMEVLQLTTTGLGDGGTFSFWAMLIGGFFLYFSYYGCDQSQAQRLLATESGEDTQKALFINGIGRFFLVLSYLILGILFIPFLQQHPDFLSQMEDKSPDYLVPYFLIRYFPQGFLGILVAGLFAASMSSIDSALNSLSAATYKDVLEKILPDRYLIQISSRKEVFISRILTIFWGIVATVFAIMMSGGQETVIELVNKIGSAFYGPVLLIFLIPIFSDRINSSAGIFALISGVGFNIFLWQFFPSTISWMWWNPLSFITGLTMYLVLTLFSRNSPGFRLPPNIRLGEIANSAYTRILLIATFIFIGIGVIIHTLFL